MTDLEKSIANVPKVFEAGREAEYDDFWDVFQNKGNREMYSYAFFGDGWTDETYNPKYDIVSSGNSYIYSNSFITDTKVVIDCATNPGNPNQTLQNAFKGAGHLKTIRKLIVMEKQSFANTFNACSALENITFEGEIGKSINFQYSPLLSKASIENIVSVLSADVTGQTLTLNQTAFDNAFTEEEWNALIADKGDWKFAFI